MEEFTLFVGTMVLLFTGIVSVAVLSTTILALGYKAAEKMYTIYYRASDNIKKIKQERKALTPEELGCKVVPSDQVHVHGGYTSREFLMMIHARNADTKEQLMELVELGNPFAKRKLDEMENEEKKKQQPKHID